LFGQARGNRASFPWKAGKFAPFLPHPPLSKPVRVGLSSSLGLEIDPDHQPCAPAARSIVRPALGSLCALVSGGKLRSAPRQARRRHACPERGCATLCVKLPGWWSASCRRHAGSLGHLPAPLPQALQIGKRPGGRFLSKRGNQQTLFCSSDNINSWPRKATENGGGAGFEIFIQIFLSPPRNFKSSTLSRIIS